MSINYNLEAISVPTLLVHTKDDQLASHEASKRAAARIPGAADFLADRSVSSIGATGVASPRLPSFAEQEWHEDEGAHSGQPPGPQPPLRDQRNEYANG